MKALRPRAYVTVYLDLLGVGRLLDQLDSLGNESLSSDARARIVENSINRILALRSQITKIYRQMMPLETGDPRAVGLPVELLEPFEESLDHDSVFRWFSDCCIISVSYHPGEPHKFLNGVFRLLWVSSLLSVVFLTKGQPLRGGVDIGYGVELDEGEVLGSNLTKAYRLESKIADMPRVLVGDDLLRVLRSPLENRSTTTDPLLARRLREMCLRLIVSDEDGRKSFVDFLGGVMQGYFRKEAAYWNLVVAACNSISERLASEEVCGCERYSKKYEWLKAYFKARGCWEL